MNTTQYNKGCDNMLIGRLEILLLTREITEEEYVERKEKRTDKIFELYEQGIITKDTMFEMMNV